MRPQIWLGDVARALKVARNDSEQAQVLQLLGFAAPVAPHSSPGPAPQRSPVSHTEAESQGPVQEPVTRPDDEQQATDAIEDGHESANVLAELPLLQPVRTEAVGVLSAPAEPLAPPTPDRAPLPHLPLLTPGWANALVRALLSQQVSEGPVDIPALIDTLAHGRPVARLPRRRVPTLRFGVQVLVDRGTAMQPFRRDQDQLVGQIRSVVGAGLVEVGYFSDLPQRGTGPGARRTRTAYTPPESGRRILLLSDLGIGGPPDAYHRGTRAEWEEFIGLVTRAGCSVVALSPYPPGRWPQWMTRLLPVVSWDRTTTTHQISARLP
ncbi:hypothetical protein [Streptomyces sp. NPDC001978]|uniref:hypothetical protein n=1 Tax=Streptomyces sp. NPDC001978 TaxID=3364627 RepID=UPI003682459F